MKALLFPGQGAQTTQMAEEILTAYPEAARLYDEAEKITGIDLVKLTEADLAQTRYSQPAIVVHSVACLEKERAAAALEGRQSEVTALAGFSLGEYTALYAAGLVTFRIFFCSSTSVPSHAGGRRDNARCDVCRSRTCDRQIEDCLAAIEDVYPVNYNCPGQVVSPEPKGAHESRAEFWPRCAPRAPSFGKRSLSYADDGRGRPRHPRIREKHRLRTAFVPLYSNAAGPPSPPEPIPFLSETHLISPVRFTDEVLRMRADGYDEFTELGPGKVLRVS
jgi:[acyl-carrier-protein] S-malonyltransferase